MTKVKARTVSRPARKRVSRKTFRRIMLTSKAARRTPISGPRKPAVLEFVDGLPVFDVPHVENAIEIARAEDDRHILGL